MELNRKKLIAAGYCLFLLIAGIQANIAAAEKPLAFTDKSDNSYVPGADYKGEFIQSRIYYRNPRSTIWLRMSVSDDYREVVKCQSALAALETNGTWLGHLNQNGSCGSQDEPAHFALGNRINYDILLDQDVSSR